MDPNFPCRVGDKIKACRQWPSVLNDRKYPRTKGERVLTDVQRFELSALRTTPFVRSRTPWTGVIKAGWLEGVRPVTAPAEGETGTRAGEAGLFRPAGRPVGLN
jgi:hypothetical protein